LKVIYLAAIFGIPTLLFGLPFLQVLIGFLLMHFVAGLVLTTVFQLAHTVEGTTHPLPDEDGNIENNWAVHQMHTTVDFCRDNKFLCWYLGGLNFQVEHHLFPTICHIHYPEIAPIVKQTAEEFGVPYLENETFAKALGAHLSALKKFGRIPSLSDAIAG
jgi:linoleoyl-CoA desaturase